MALLRPPLHQFDQLTQPLNNSELATAQALAQLDDGWTVYVQPKVALDRPDFLAVHALLGVCIIEVRDWSPEVSRPQHDEPRFVAARTRTVVFDQFFALPSDGTKVTEAVRAAVILPRCTNEQAVRLLGTSEAEGDERAVEVWGADGLRDQLDRVVRGTGCAHPRPESIDRVRRHVVASEIAPSRPDLAPRSSGAFEIEVNKQGGGVRRARGAAGSGKSFGLAARAAHLAAQGKQVLVLSFNVTLANHLRSLVTDRCAEYGTNPTRVTCTNFHSMCTRIVQDAARAGIEPAAPRGDRWTTAIVKKAEGVLRSGNVPRYDAVLVDEGQDFEAGWWHLLHHHLLAPNGEMLLVADPTQDIYDRTTWQNDEAMVDAGFDTEWLDLAGSYRMPADLVQHTANFAAHRVGGQPLIADTPTDLAEVSGASHGSLRLWQTVDHVGDLGTAVGREVVRLLKQHPVLKPADVAFICEYHHDGVAAVREIEAAGYPVHHIFSRDPDDARRRRKYRFSPEADAISGSTVHSFKGWQTSVLVMGIGLESRSKRMAYVAMTRVQNHAARPAVLSVVSADKRLEDFGAAFAGTPDLPAAPAAASPSPAPAAAPAVPTAASSATPPAPVQSATAVADPPMPAPLAPTVEAEPTDVIALPAVISIPPLPSTPLVAPTPNHPMPSGLPRAATRPGPLTPPLAPPAGSAPLAPPTVSWDPPPTVTD
jgi:hypothetical protein